MKQRQDKFSNEIKDRMKSRFCAKLTFYFPSFRTGILALVFCAACSPVSPPTLEDAAGKPPAETKSPEGGADVFGWETMPAPGLPSPDEQAAGGGDRSKHHPRGEPAGKPFPLEHAVWQAGFWNGLPPHPGADAPEGEYGPARFGEAVVQLHDLNDLPPVLEAGQRLVIHLQGFPADLYSARVALGTPLDLRSNLDYSREDSLAGRQWVVRWNDRLILNAPFAPGHALVSALVFPEEVREDGNLLTLQNTGKRAVALDAVWLEPARSDTVPFGVLAEEAQWLNRGDALWIRQSLIRVEGPRMEHARRVALPELQHVPPANAREVQARWRGAAERFQQLVDLEHPDVETLRGWIAPLGDAVRRGITPSVAVVPPPGQPSLSLDAAMYVFGDFVHSWYVTIPQRGQDAIDRNPERIAGIRLVIEAPLVRGPDAPPVPAILHADTPLEYRIRLAKARATRFGIERGFDRLYVRDMEHSMLVRQPDGAAFHHWGRQDFALMFLESVAEVLMHTRHQIVVAGLHPAGPFFPDGSDKAGAAWSLMKPLFRFGGPSHRKGHARLRPTMDSLSLGSTSWAVADNGRDSVHVLIQNPPHLNGREVTLEVPLPWSGPTRVLHHQPPAHGQASAAARSETRTLETQPMGGDLPETHPYASKLRMGITLDRLHVLELSPAEQPGDGPAVQAPEQVGFAGMKTTNSLFTLSPQPPPSAWCRGVVIANSRASWMRYGQAEVRTGVDATLSSLSDWQTRHSLQPASLVNHSGVTPLQAKSVRIRFGESAAADVSFIQTNFIYQPLHYGHHIGIWMRAHRPPNLDTPPGTTPTASFYIGKPPYRQRIELPYDAWVFAQAPASRIREQDFTYQPRLLFWADPASRHPLDLEINDVSGYQISRTRAGPAPEESHGFLREREDGKLVLLLVGTPGKAGFWRQRLERAVDTAKLARVLSAATESDPADPKFEYHPASRLLETHVTTFPPPPDEALLSRIRRDFPAVADRLREGQLSAVLWEER